MASTSQTIDIIFNGIDKTVGAVSSVIGNVESGTNKLKSIAQPIADVTAGILKFEGAILASGAALTAFAVKTAGDFDGAFREIATLIDAPLDQLGAFKQSILDYSTSSTQSLDSITGAVYSAISAGVKYTDSLSVVRQAEQLAVAGKADLKDSMVLLVSSLNAYGKSAEDAQSFSDALFTTVKDGQTTLPELAGSLSQVTKLAASAGVSFDEVLSAVAALTAAGDPTSQAVTEVRGALTALIKPSSEAQAEAAKLGIQFDASALKSKGLAGVLNDVATATGGNTDEMAKLFGRVEGLSGVLTLTGQGADKFTQTLKDMQNSTGATAEAFGKMADSMDNEGQKIANALKATLVAIGTPLLDEFGGVADAIAAIFSAIRDSVDQGALGDFMGGIEALAQQAEASLQEVARNLPAALAGADFSAFLDGLNSVKDAVLSVFDGVDLTSAEGLQHVIEVTGQGFQTLSTFVGSTITAIGPFIQMLADLADFVAHLDPGIVKVAGAIGGIATVAAPVLSVLTSLGKLLTSLTGSAGSLVKALANPTTGLIAVTALSAVEVYKAVNAYQSMRDAQREAAAAQERASASAADLAEKYKEISERTGVSITSVEEFHKAIADGLIVADKANHQWVAAGQVQRDYNAEVKAAAEAGYDWNEVLKGLVDSNGNLIGAVTKAADSTKDAKQAAIDAAAAYYEMQGNSADVARRMAELDAQTSKTSTTMKEAAKQSDALKEKMEELASNERIKNVEMAVSLKTTDIENQTDRIKAAFVSVNDVLAQTGKSIDDISGMIAGISSTDPNSMTKTNLLIDQLDKENSRRDEALQMQKDLVEAQVESINLRNDAMRNGQGLIKIDSSGLEPALELVMWQILEKVQVRVNEEASDFLIGLNGA